MDQISKSRISVWTTETEIVVALLCEKDLTRFYYIQILFYGNDVSSQENNGTNSILVQPGRKEKKTKINNVHS